MKVLEYLKHTDTMNLTCVIRVPGYKDDFLKVSDADFVFYKNEPLDKVYFTKGPDSTAVKMTMCLKDRPQRLKRIFHSFIRALSLVAAFLILLISKNHYCENFVNYAIIAEPSYSFGKEVKEVDSLDDTAD